jgi:ethanolamine utilization protein EutA (predicted chaperonin)
MRKGVIDIDTVVLQNCVDLERVVPGSCSETCPTSSHDANQVINIKVEGGSVNISKNKN